MRISWTSYWTQPFCCLAFIVCSAASWTLFGLAPARAEDGPAATARSHARPTTTDLEFFERKVRPLLVQHCYKCHSADAEKLQAGLQLDSRAAMLRGGDSGAAIVPGDITESLLIESVRYESYEMPPKGKLSDEDVATLERWVELGAPWPEETGSQVESTRATFDLQQRAAEHWAWQPITASRPPPVQHQTWPLSDADRFILARLEQASLAPAPDVDRATLLRRLCFDLLGLPPTTAQQSEFLLDSENTTQATERMVDQLLQSPHFGERWGRHWLDLVRYAESRGHEFDDESENAFQYRDYVIRALNADVPYDQFVREHIAGDLLPQPRLHPALGFNESILGTGFWFLGEWVHSPVDIRKDETDRFDNMIDVMSKTFLGLTVACARCHDHKFDAISTADYYSLSGFLQSSDYRQVRFDTIQQDRKLARQLAEVDTSYRQQIEQLLADKLATLDAQRPSPIVADSTNPALIITYYEDQHADFMQDGFIFGERPRRAGELTLAPDGQLRCVPHTAAASDPFWQAMESTGQASRSRSILSPLQRSGRTLRTETFKLTGDEVWCRVHGAGHVFACVDSHYLVAGPLHAQTLRTIAPNQPWVKLDLSRYVGHRLQLQFTPDSDTQLQVSAVLQNSTPEKLAQGKRAIEQFERRQIDWSAQRQQRIEQIKSEAPKLAAEIGRLTTQWHAKRLALQSSMNKTSRLAMAMIDSSEEDDHVLIRGSAANPGKREPRHFLTALSGDRPMKIAGGSGRLELAQQINDPDNPLPSRVIVNRLWHHLMGRGLVPTTDDFGVLGKSPTHPELLDFLAQDFLDNGRSIKHSIRTIVLSRTYRMSGQIDPHAMQVDPNNELWHYRPPRRLEGEAIRDALLAISGELNPTMFGEPVPIHLTPFMEGRGRPAKSGPMTGNARRSIYIAVRRNFLSPFMLAFDTPSPFSTMGRRNSSNVPAQALILMNDPLVAHLTQAWAKSAMHAVPVEDESDGRHSSATQSRIAWFYQSGLGRDPNEREVAVASQFIAVQAEQRSLAIDSIELWQDLAHALVNTKEFIFVR